MIPRVAVDDARQQPQPVAVQEWLVPAGSQTSAERRHPAVKHADIDRAGEAAAHVQGADSGDEDA